MLTAVSLALSTLCQKFNYSLQVLEKKLRDKKTNIWLGANHPSHEVKAGLYKIIKIQPGSPLLYSMMVHMGPKDYCLSKIYEHWPTYDKNYEALMKTGGLAFCEK